MPSGLREARKGGIRWLRILRRGLDSAGWLYAAAEGQIVVPRVEVVDPKVRLFGDAALLMLPAPWTQVLVVRCASASSPRAFVRPGSPLRAATPCDRHVPTTRWSPGARRAR